jgi:CheY-like chemotaxis protein
MRAAKDGAMRVLIVDDYPGVVELFDLALRARGFEVVGARTVGEAMSIAAVASFDAVVVDVELPDGTGVELTDRLRVLPWLAEAKFIGMSSYTPDPMGKRFDRFLRKPFPPRRLATLLRRLLAPARVEPLAG